jgi:hypothetical protein
MYLQFDASRGAATVASIVAVMAAGLLLSACETARSPAPAPAEASSEPTPAPVAAGSGEGVAADPPAPGSGAAEGSDEATAGSSQPSTDSGADPGGTLPFRLPDGSIRPFTDAERAILLGTPDDAIPEVLDAVMEENQGTHFLYSDELHLYNFRERMLNLGGGYVGVGSDQAWLFMGWQRPEVAWMADYDPWIAALHRVYVLFFQTAPDIETFHTLWSQDAASSSLELVRTHFADHADLSLIVEVFRTARPRVNRRLNEIRRIGRDITPTFMTDPEQYDYIRQMVMAGRVRPMIGNLLAERGYVGIGDTARQLGVTIRHVYISNAEDYWAYPEQFRVNMRALPFDEQSIISRARASKPRNGDYRYMQQPALNFVRWLDAGVGSCRRMWGYAAIREDEFPITWFTEEPESGAAQAGDDGSGDDADNDEPSGTPE